MCLTRPPPQPSAVESSLLQRMRELKTDVLGADWEEDEETAEQVGYGGGGSVLALLTSADDEDRYSSTSAPHSVSSATTPSASLLAKIRRAGVLPPSLPLYGDWEFAVWGIPPTAYGPVFLDLLEGRRGLVTTLGLDPRRVIRFAEAARDSYWRDNPFHNAFHGLHVCQAVSMLLERTGLHALLPPLEQFALLVAGLCHDVDHPGVSNAFLVAVEDELAVTYNDMPDVLENHHAAVSIGLMRDVARGTDIVFGLSAAQKRRVRQVLIAGILATNMSKHFDVIVPRARGLQHPLCRPLNADGTPRSEASLASERVALGELILHAADLSGQVLSWPLASEWSDRIVREFQAQAHLEAGCGLVCTPHMANLVSPEAIANLQIGFLEYVLAPLWRPLADTFPGLADRVEMLESNARQHRVLAYC